MKRTFIDVPNPKTMSPRQAYAHLLKSVVLSPFYCALAYVAGTPGLRFRKACAHLGFQLIKRKMDRSSFWSSYGLIFSPMDSTRYFEFDFASRYASTIPVQHYLDVSSPRLFPLVFLVKRPETTGTLVNPDPKDMAITAALCRDLGLEARCTLTTCLIEEVSFAPASFDLITCISVLEHIPDDIHALLHMWSLLKRGGHIILTVPCKAKREEQYISRDEYGILHPGSDGYTFWQRYYDDTWLRDNIFNNIGHPVRSSIFGEIKDGTFAANAAWKRASGPFYPYWQEPYLMGRDYRLYRSIADLPGEGVIAMEFIKR